MSTGSGAIQHAAPPWHRTPHTLEMRQAINALVSRKMLNYLEQSDPVLALLEHLEALARKGKSVPPLYLEARRRLVESLGVLAGPCPEQPPGPLPIPVRPPTPSVLPPPRKAING